MKEIINQFIDLGISGVMAFFVWRCYRGKTYSADEKYSTFWPRFWTGSVDSCVLWPVQFAGYALSLVAPTPVVAFLSITQSLAWACYTVVMHAKYGQTYGKMVCKVRVVDSKTEGALSWQ